MASFQVMMSYPILRNETVSCLPMLSQEECLRLLRETPVKIGDQAIAAYSSVDFQANGEALLAAFMALPKVEMMRSFLSFLFAGRIRALRHPDAVVFLCRCDDILQSGTYLYSRFGENFNLIGQVNILVSPREMTLERIANL